MVAPRVKQTWVVMGVLLNMFGQGLVLSFTSVLMPAILAPDSDIKADLNMASWLATCLAVASIPGFFLSSFLMDRFGRKFAHLLAIIPGIIGWILIYFASNYFMLIIGRVLGGFTAGCTIILGAVVTGEYTSPENRGMFLICKAFSGYIGNMTSHIIGNYLKWNTVALVSTIPFIIVFLIVSTWPESPAWLASKKKFEECEKSFYWLRGTSPKSRKELEELIRAQKEINHDEKYKPFLEKYLEVFNKFTNKDFIKPTTIIIFSSVAYEACGANFFAAYASQIINEMTGSKTNSFYYTLGIDITVTATAVVSSVLVKVMKRRTLFFWSGFGALLALIVICLYLFLSAFGTISNSKPWVAVTLLIAFFIISNLGCTAIPLVLLGELYPLAYRGIGSSISGVVSAGTMMVALYLTPHLLVVVKVYGTFAFYGAAMGISLVTCSIFFLKRKTEPFRRLSISLILESLGTIKLKGMKKREQRCFFNQIRFFRFQ